MFVPIPPEPETDLPPTYLALLSRLGVDVPLAARSGAEGIRPELVRDRDGLPALLYHCGRPERMQALLLLERPLEEAWGDRVHLLYLWRPEASRLERLLSEPGPIVFSWSDDGEPVPEPVEPRPPRPPALRLVGEG